MRADFGYIEDTIERVMEKENTAPTITPQLKADVEKKARRLVGGFRVYDKKVEAVEIDRAVKAKQAIVAQFRKNREMLQRELADLGVKPLAIVPSGAWYVLAKAAGLYTMHPDHNGQVGIHQHWFSGLGTVAAFKKIKNDEFLRRLFPDNVSVDPSTRRVTLILPDPPADVAETLLKAQKRKLSVTAVAEAISFVEDRDKIWEGRGTDKDIWARAQGYADYADWVKRDPIVFTEEGNAAAIIAQFGDFPIEKELVDKAIDADAVMALKPGAVNDMILSNHEFLRQQQDMMIVAQGQAAGPVWVNTIGGGAGGGSLGVSLPIRSASWTDQF